MRRATASRKEGVGERQQVPVLAGFLTEVIGSSFTTVNWKPSPLSSGLGIGPWGCATAAKLISAAASRKNCFISVS